MTSWSIFIGGPVPTKGSYKPGKSGKMRPACDWLNEWTGRACADVLASDPPKWERHQPVSVQMQITVERPHGHFTVGRLNSTGRKYPGPTRERDGDWDKHARAVSDMLQLAGVLDSDAQVVSPGPDSWMQWSAGRSPGIMITVTDYRSVGDYEIHFACNSSDSYRYGHPLCVRASEDLTPIAQNPSLATDPNIVTCPRCREMMRRR